MKSDNKSLSLHKMKGSDMGVDLEEALEICGKIISLVCCSVGLFCFEYSLQIFCLLNKLLN